MKKNQLTAFLVLGVCGALSACSTSTDRDKATASQSTANDVEITLVDKLDGTTSSYCLDIMGGGDNIKVEEGLQAHTCYSYKGTLGTDQVFDRSRFANQQFYLPNFDVCMVANTLKAGKKLDLSSCDNSAAQQFNFGSDGTIRPVNESTLCVTASGETTYGRSKKHQKKELTLEACSAEMSAKQQWRARTSAED